MRLWERTVGSRAIAIAHSSHDRSAGF